MSIVEQLKEQLYAVAQDANQGAGSLGGFQNKFDQSAQQVLHLIQGSATGADADITDVLNTAAQSLGAAVESLHIAAQKCSQYAQGL